MSRYLVTFGLLGSTILWLVLSYAPIALPPLTFSSATVLAWFPALALVVLGVFALLQVDLIRATVRMVRHPADGASRAAVQMFGLHTGREVLWTALPLVGTLLLALWLIGV